MKLLHLMRFMHFLSDKKKLEYFPPFFLMRAKVTELTPNWGRIRIKLPLTLFSQNMGGCMFGGHQASLADPIAALACVKRFPTYSVWTRSMKVDFQREGSSDLELRFDFTDEQEKTILKDLAETGRSNPVFEYGLYLKDGTLCTHVVNTVAIRPKGYSNEKPTLDDPTAKDRIEKS